MKNKQTTVRFYIWLHEGWYFNYSRYKKCLFSESAELVGEMQMKETKLSVVHSDFPKKNEISVMKIYMSKEFWPPIGAHIQLSENEGRNTWSYNETKVFICKKVVKYHELDSKL